MPHSSPPPHSSSKAPDSHRDDGRRSTGSVVRRSVPERARLAGAPQREGRSPRALALSVVLHVAVGVAMLELLTFGHGLSGFLGLTKSKQREERISYVSPVAPKVTPATPVAPRRTPTPTPRLSLPSPNVEVSPPAAVPTPAVAPAVARADTGGGVGSAASGTGVGALDPNLRGVQPGYTDARIWRGSAGGGNAAPAPSRNGTERLDSIISFAITSVADSLDAVARSEGRYNRAPGDWTKKGKNGEKWGWDNAGIRLGKVVIPNALLTLLPLNAQVAMSGNSTAIDRERRLSASRADIMRNADLALGDLEFRKLVNELRDRREKERRDRLRAPDASLVPAKPIATKPIGK